MRIPLPRTALLAITAAIVGGILIVAQPAKSTGGTMADQATKLLGTLNADQKKKASFAIDDPHRAAWFFTPQQDKEKKSTRKGLRLDSLTAEQKDAVMGLLKMGLSARGYEQATTIISLESLLAELEGKTGAMTRDPMWYFISFFGEPSNTGLWGWRLEGHHLSVNFTLDKGEIVSATPLLFGVNPAEVKTGTKKGLRATPEIEEVAKELIKTLTDDQNKSAKQAKQFPEIREGKPDAGVGEPVGVTADKLTADQRKTLRKLIEAYANRLPGDLAASELKKVEASMDKVHFGYCIEASKPGSPYSYRIQGPTFVIEFLNIQADSAKNPANHIHSGWRSLPMDFAMKK